jgi:hypothetical protein
MKDTCFYTCFDGTYIETGTGLVKSIKRIYPNIDVHVFALPKREGFNLRDFCAFHLQKGKELLEDYQRVISVDPDSIFCSPCYDLFGDFDMGVVQNNIPVGDIYGGVKDNVYINAGLDVCTSKVVWQEYIDEFNRRCDSSWNELNEQNALNWVFHNSKHNIKLLEFPDRVYGITAMSWYDQMYVKNDYLYVDGVWNQTKVEKRLCIFHAAGDEWKDKPTGKINFDRIINLEAKEKLKGLTL